MKNDIISQYKKYHNLDDNWEKEMREKIKNLDQPKNINEENSQQVQTTPNKQYDHPNTMEDSSAIILYIIVMLAGVIFLDRWLIWIVATVIFIRFITRHKK